ncbi:tumor necrosis factor ligand superfamily member 8 [Suncus etruscus]|uniref:tumor necrosis factor ligand superfamily member 8 n=1 Tax=Suncus etruscus TaxID=109475 RepID=UPI0021108FF5|nr:tumor necrosis factor ligand superfamily member 8 [Suncus etruscus]
MDPGLQQALHRVAPSQDTTMHVPAASDTGHLGSTSRSCVFFTTATLALCLIFAMATIMVLVVQRTDFVHNSPDKFSLQGGNCSEDILCILRRAPFKKSCAYLQVSKHINTSKLSWNKHGIIHGVKYQNGSLVIESPGLYFIICQLQFLVKFPGQPVDLKMELLINNEVKRQALVTVYESGTQTKNIYQNLSLFLLENLQINNTISIQVNNFQYVDTDTFPLDSVLSIFSYSSSD